LFCVGVVTINRWRKEGKLKCRQVGQRLLIKRTDIEDLLEGSVVE
jgi:predicted site-specific integrase-resolvase